MRNPLGQALYWVQGVAEMEKAVPSLLGASTPEGEGLTVGQSELTLKGALQSASKELEGVWSEEVLSSPPVHPTACPRVTCQVGALPQVRVCPSGHTHPALAQDLVLPAAK